MSQTKQSVGASVETRMMKALSHPLRWRILDHLAAGPASPSTIATELGEPLGNVSYHVKILLKYDAIELVETRPVRGALEHVYRAKERPLEHLVASARAAGGVDDANTHVSWTKLDLDRRAYEELSGMLTNLTERAMELQAETAGRAADRPGGPAERQETELAIFQYRRAPAAE